MSERKAALPVEDTITRFLKDSSEEFERVKNQRDDIDERNKVADYMYQCAANRTIEAAEKSKGMNLTASQNANVGSVIFHRQVNQLSSQLSTVMLRDDLCKYYPRTTEGIHDSGENAIDASAQANALWKYNAKRCDLKRKTPEFSTSLFKYSDIFMCVSWREIVRRKVIKEPVINQSEIDEATGKPIPQVESENMRVEEGRDGFCDFFLLHADQLWADRDLGSIENQNTIFIARIRTRSEIWGDVQSGLFDEEQYEKLTDDMKYDGSHLGEKRKEKTENRPGQTATSNDAANVFLQWDVFHRAPIAEGGSYEDDAPPVLWWGSVIGNDIGQGVCLRLERNPDPDDEIPIKDVHVYPDDSGNLYHTAISDIVRSHYSVDCTLTNLALDNLAKLNKPTTLYVPGRHQIRNFANRIGAVWPVDNVEGVVKELQPTASTFPTMEMKSAIINESMMALATDKPLMGMSHGGRTSATESNAITQNTLQPHLVQIRYILYQLVPWMARKNLSYWRVFGNPRVVFRISEMNKVYEINIPEIVGEFDVDVDVIDDYIDDTVRQARGMQLLNIIASSPWLQSSPRHTVMADELLSQVLDLMRFKPTRIIDRRTAVDSQRIARLENDSMILGGQYVDPQQGEDHPTHLSIHKSERSRWRGVEDQNPNVDLLDQHILMTEQMVQQADTAAQNVRMAGMQQNETPGEVAGNELAGLMGAAQGGGA